MPLQRTLGQYTNSLLLKLQPHFLGSASPRIAVDSHFHLGMLVHHIIAHGRDAYDEVSADPAKAAGYVATLNRNTGLLLHAVFWMPTLQFWAQKCFVLFTITSPDHWDLSHTFLDGEKSIVPGAMDIMFWLAKPDIQRALRVDKPPFLNPGVLPNFVSPQFNGAEWSIAADAFNKKTE